MKQLRMTALCSLIFASAVTWGLMANAQTKGSAGSGSGSAPKKVYKGLQACIKDKMKYCSKVKGKKETKACLQENESKLSVGCKAALAASEKNGSGAGSGSASGSK